MQVFVNRSQLNAIGQDTVPIVASYQDDVSIAASTHGANVVKLSVPSAAVEQSATGGAGGIVSGMVLAKDWRETYKAQVVGSEASYRILDVFPEYSQRNSIFELESYVLQHGDLSKWPAHAKARKAEIDRCWNYVNAVRAKVTALMNASLPRDPTADGSWPARITPYQPQPA